MTAKYRTQCVICPDPIRPGDQMAALGERGSGRWVHAGCHLDIEVVAAVVSDSTYVVNCFRDRWWQGWQARGWLNAARKPVANRDLWEPLVELVQRRGDVTFRWVKGHSGDPMNDLVDRLAVAAAASVR
jgi:hypothetical protein